MGLGRDLLFTLSWKAAETSRKICEDFFFWSTFFAEIRRLLAQRPFFFFFFEVAWKIFLETFFFFENNCALCPWL